jgi:uncharacterized protein (TIGR02453 family)
VSTFAGIPRAAVTFYAGLEADNSREFWAAHKEIYETKVREPMLALLDELEDEFGEAKLFRPYRDLRFSKDKTPYKTAQGAFVGARTGTGWYVRVGADGLVAGGGFRSHGSPEVAALRAAVDDDSSGPELVGILGRLERDGCQVEGDATTRVPRGYPADHPRADLLRCRSLMVTKDFGTPRWMSSPRAVDEVRAVWRSVTPLAEWVQTNVNP